MLAELYLITLLHNSAKTSSSAEHCTGKFAADLIVFVQWFDAEQKGQKFEKLWREIREREFEKMYDYLFDVEMGFELLLNIYTCEVRKRTVNKIISNQKFKKIQKIL